MNMTTLVRKLREHELMFERLNEENDENPRKKRKNLSLKTATSKRGLEK